MTDTIEAELARGIAHPDIAKRRCRVSARDAAEATRPMQARRGRASYTGERSIGSVDPGAVAVAVLAETRRRHLVTRTSALRGRRGGRTRPNTTMWRQ